MVKNHYRWDFIGLSTDTKPTPDTSEKVADGSTFYESDTSRYYVWCQDDWYEKTATGGGGGGGAVNTVNNVSPDSSGNVELTPSDIGAQAALTAGSNITIDDGTISATDTTYSNFVGTDGTSAGAAGLVPAPAAGDESKVLKGDGTWAVPEGGIKTLTTADYNYPANNPQYVLLCLLPAGIYKVPNGISARIGASTAVTPGRDSVAYVDIKPSTGYATITADGNGYGLMTVDVLLSNYSETIKLLYSVVDSLTSSNRIQPLSANQGKVLKGLVDAKADKTAFTGTDGTSAGTAGLVPAPATTDAGKFLKADGTWDDAGSSVNVVQTTGTSTTDVMSQNAVTSMVYNQPNAILTSNIRIGRGANSASLGPRAIAIATQSSGSSNVTGANAIGIGFTPVTNADNAIAIGARASATGAYSIAFGGDSSATAAGEMNIGAYRQGIGNVGYNGSAYRLLTGLYEPQSAHDAATKGYVDNAVINGGTTQPTTSTVGAVGTQYNCVNNGTPEIYICTDDTGSTYTWTKVH